MTLRGLLLDLDGTLADSIAALKCVYFDFLASFGLAGSEAEFAALNGPPLAEVVRRLAATHALPGTPQDLFSRYAALVHRAHDHAPPAEGAEALLTQARAAGWRIAVVTSAPHAGARAWLKQAGLLPLIDTVVGGDDVTAGKPAPEPYRLGLARLDCRAELSLAVEDSRQGAAAARAAGIATLAICPPERRQGWPEGVRFITALAETADVIARWR